ncbi:MerR family transcriptional regulator [Lapidilactobacillus concavus DSM 17758]|jgi:DNA-binding transcriptional MerR regulator|uniref:MerR family transcriptional regulator n=2 Tax=Lapidilactobacillus TaxID=2767884 RepID=A0A0R1W140_9LACO|nr:MerR family transcriptional regulator [Lapidilactobacillus concavus DSM 17758]
MSQANLRSSLNFKKRKEVDEMSQETYTIGQVATRFNLSVSTLRYYDQEGLIPNLTKDQAGIRRFNNENLEALQVVECLKTSGMSIKDIKQFMQWSSEGDETLAQRLTLFQKLREHLESQLDLLERNLRVVDYKCAYYGQAVEDGTEARVKQTGQSIREIANH